MLVAHPGRPARARVCRCSCGARQVREEPMDVPPAEMQRLGQRVLGVVPLEAALATAGSSVSRAR